MASWDKPRDEDLSDATGKCDFCGTPDVPLVARLKADPDQSVCATCHADPRIPTERKAANG